MVRSSSYEPDPTTYSHKGLGLARETTVYREIFVSLNFREFRVSFPIRENLFREILGGVAHY